jgi:TPR repeat protein
LKYDKEMADKGDAYSQRRMGERFRDGDGVEKSLATARTWLALAAGQGDKQAARELDELPTK